MNPKESTTRRTFVGTLARLSGVSLLASACSQHQDPMDPTNGNVTEITLVDFAFSEPSLTVAVGTTVRWRNTTSTFHTVTPDGHSEWTEWQTSGVGETFDVTFDQAGTFPYFCQPHRSIGMTGTVIVQ